MPPTKEDYEAIRPGLYNDVQQLNADAPENRPVSGKTLRKTFVNWMTLAGMDAGIRKREEACCFQGFVEAGEEFRGG